MLETSNNNELPPIPGKSYFTIGGARQRLVGDDAKEDRTQSSIVVKQMITELEDLLRELKS